MELRWLGCRGFMDHMIWMGCEGQNKRQNLHTTFFVMIHDPAYKQDCELVRSQNQGIYRWGKSHDNYTLLLDEYVQSKDVGVCTNPQHFPTFESHLVTKKQTPAKSTRTANCPMRQESGPAIIEREQYIKLTIQDHLGDRTTYKPLTRIRRKQLVYKFLLKNG